MTAKKRIVKISEAVNEGINSIIKEHPRFAGFEEYLIKHTDKKKLRENVEELVEKARASDLSGEETYRYIFHEIADYVSSGEAFDEKGKKIILKSGLEEKTKKGIGGFLSNLFNKPKFDGEKYMDQSMEAFQDLYALFKTGDYSRRMPELKKSVETLYDLKFLSPAVEVLKSYGLIDEKKYEFLREKIYRKTAEASKSVVGGIERYITPEKAIASIFGVVGTVFILVNSEITGAVVGNSKIVGGISGFVLLAISVFMLIASSRKKQKRKYISQNNI